MNCLKLSLNLSRVSNQAISKTNWTWSSPLTSSIFIMLSRERLTLTWCAVIIKKMQWCSTFVLGSPFSDGGTINFWYVDVILTCKGALLEMCLLAKTRPTLLQSASSDLSGQSLALSHLQTKIDKHTRLDALSHLLRMSMQKPLAQENSEELQEVRARERCCWKNLLQIGNLPLVATCFLALHSTSPSTSHSFVPGGQKTSPGTKHFLPITKEDMAAWDTAKSWGLLATVKFHWDRIGSKVILEWRCPESGGQYWLTKSMIQFETTPINVIIPVCLSLRMAKKVSKPVLKDQENYSKMMTFLTCLVHKPLSCSDFDPSMVFGNEQAVQGWLQR